MSEEIKHHVAEEENPTSGIFVQAEQANVATQHLAKQLGDRKRDLTIKANAGGLGSPEPRSFRTQTHVGMKHSLEENPMARNSTAALERDDRGRFVGDDDDRRYSRPRDEEGRFTSSRSRSRYDDDDDDRRYSRPRDEEGRFASSRSRSRYEDDDDDRRYSRPRDEEGRFTSSRSRSRYDDNDDERRGGRGHGGWYGDPRGHSEAARRGWDEREGSTRSRYRDEDEPRSSRYADDDDDRRYSRPRDEEGRFTSSRSRSRYDDDDDEQRGGRGHGGWYGDPEVIRRLRGAAGMSARARPALATAMRTMTGGARAPARGMTTTMTSSAAVAVTAAGTAIPEVTQKLHAAGADSRPLHSGGVLPPGWRRFVERHRPAFLIKTKLWRSHRDKSSQ